MRPEALAALLGWCLTKARDSGSEWSTLPGPRHRRNRRPPFDPLERLPGRGRKWVDDFGRESLRAIHCNAHAATLGLLGVIATMDGSSRLHVICITFCNYQITKLNINSKKLIHIGSSDPQTIVDRDYNL